MRLKDICVLDAVCCPPDTSIEAAAREMRKRHVGDLIVVDDGDEEREPIGIVTDRDIVLEVVALGRDPAKVKVSEIMSNNVVVAAASEEVRVALERMTMHGVRRIPILDDAGFVLGIISLDDLLLAHAEEGAALAQVVTKAQRTESRARR